MPYIKKSKKGEYKVSKNIDEERMKRHQQYLDKHLPAIECLFNIFQDKINNSDHVAIIDTRHKDKRALERAVSQKDIMTVLKNGDIIETSKIDESTYDVLIMSYVKNTTNYRPLHISAIFDADRDMLKIKTVYDPRSKEEQWTNSYTTRVFFK